MNRIFDSARSLVLVVTGVSRIKFDWIFLTEKTPALQMPADAAVGGEVSLHADTHCPEPKGGWSRSIHVAVAKN